MFVKGNSLLVQETGCGFPSCYAFQLHCISKAKAGSVLQQQISSLLPAYHDKDGNKIEFWELKKTCFGTVLDKAGKFTIVPSSRIQNPLNPKESGGGLLDRIKKISVNRWDFVYSAEKNEIIIWPHLVAAGLDDSSWKPFPFSENQAQIKHIFREQKGHLKDSPQSRAIVQSATDHPDNFVGRDRHGNDIYFKRLPDGKQAWARVYGGQIRNGGVNDKPSHLNRFRREIDQYPNRFAQLDKSEQRKYAPKERDLTQVRELAQKTDRVRAQRFGGWGGSGGDDGGKPPPSGGNDPATKDFTQRLQQTRLTDSYNGTHRQNPVPAKGGTAGDIGGVGCSIDYIQGLFESPESLFEGDHCFCMSLAEGQRRPFTDNQLQQILREIAVGVYTHNTIPFFSLHFRQGSADLFPVIHPAYQNTLVGRVIGMLDYFMKGYLNGGVFTEEFIDKWHKKAQQDPASSLEYLIDFGEYCKEHFEDSDEQYLSVEHIREGLRASLVERAASYFVGESQSQTLSELSCFGNSFRIIAKQNSFQKKGNVFFIDSDFDVFYTIAPPPVYESEKDRYIREKGENPPSYNFLMEVYEMMRERIHDHMVKMPLCRDYFAMLGIINFFSSYFSTLKKHRKIPVFFPLEQVDRRGCPPLFPHLPITVCSKEDLRINFHLAMKDFISENHAALFKYVKIFFDHCFSSKTLEEESVNNEARAFLEPLLTAIVNTSLNLCSPAFRRFILANMEKTRLKILFAEKAVNLISEINSEIVKLVKKEQSASGGKYKALQDAWIIWRCEDKIQTFLKELPTLWENQTETKIEKVSYKAVALHSELKPKEVEINKSIVGGCGMRLEEKKLQSSSKAAFILEHNSERLYSLAPESWQEIDMEDDSKGLAFRLSFEDVPAWLMDNYKWMEFLLMPERGLSLEDIEKREQIVEAMQAPDKQMFTKLLEGVSDVSKMNGKDGVSLLHIAAREKDPFYVECLLRRNLSPRIKDANGYLPVHYAAMQGAVETLKLLLSRDSDTRDSKSTHGSSPLTTAIQHAQHAAAEYLIAQRPRPSLLTGGYTDLHCALHEGNPEIIRMVLSCDALVSAAINVCSEEGGTPLMLACELDSLEFVQDLLARGADVCKARRDGVTALEISIRLGNVSISRELLKRTIPSALAIEAAVKEGTVEMVETLSSARGFVQYKNGSGDNVLHQALRHGNIPVALYLTKYPTLFHDENIEKDSPLHLAATVGAWEVVEKLYTAGARPNLEKLLSVGYNPILKKMFSAVSIDPIQLNLFLLKALQTGNYLVISYILVPMGARLEAVIGPTGWTALHYLAKADAIFLFKSEIEKVDDLLLPLPKEGNKTLAYIAAESGSSRVFSFLLTQIKEESLPLTNHFHDRHLLYGVIASGNFEMVQEMIELLPDLVNIEIDSQKMRPIHLAVCLGHLEMAKFLEKKGANLIERDCEQHSALYYALRVRDKKTAAFLLEKRVPIGAEELLIASEKESLFSLLVQEGVSQEILDGALYRAIETTNMKGVEKLRGAGASFTYQTPDGWTPTLRATYLGSYGLLEEILKAPPLDRREVGGNNALHLACLQGHAGCAKLLVEAGFCPKQPNGSGKTAFDLSQDKVIVKSELLKESAGVIKNISDFIECLQSLGVNKITKTILEELPKDEMIFIKGVWGTPFQLIARFSSRDDLNRYIDLFSDYLPSDPNIQDSQGETLAHLLIRKNVEPFDIPGIRFDVSNHKGQTPLHIAVEESSNEMLKKLLNLKSVSSDLVNKGDNKGQTPIFYALAKRIKNPEKDNGKLLALIEKGADLAHKDHVLNTPLIIATNGMDLIAVRLLVEKGADPNQVGTIERVSPLHIAAAKEHKEAFRYLLFHGANPNLLLNEQVHIMGLAAQTGNTEIMSLLAAGGISLDIRDHKGRRAKHQAASSGKTDILERMRRLQIDDMSASIDLPMEWHSDDGDEKAVIDGMTPMHLAAFYGHSETVEWFLRNHADPEAKNKQGVGVLSFAARSAAAPAVFEQFKSYRLMQNPKNIFSALIETIKMDNLAGMIYLYQWGVSVNTSLVEKETGLHHACRAGSLECTAWLLQNGADPHCDNTESKNSFEISAANSSAEQFQLLLDYAQIDPDELHHHTQSLLHIATRAGNLKHTMLLLVRGASVDFLDSGGRTPLHIAVEVGNIELARFLLACGANAYAKDGQEQRPIDLVDEEDVSAFKELFFEFEKVQAMSKEGDSKLHFAVRYGHPLAVLTLAQTEDLEQNNCEGQTALQLALQHGESEVSRLLCLGACQVDMKI
jgi:ankyrin repeat protein